MKDMATSKEFKEGFNFYIKNLGIDGKEHNVNLAVENPYITGPDTRDKAYKWWSGLHTARMQIRQAPKRPKRNKKLNGETHNSEIQ
jgi:hypothetical protein